MLLRMSFFSLNNEQLNFFNSSEEQTLRLLYPRYPSDSLQNDAGCLDIFMVVQPL